MTDFRFGIMLAPQATNWPALLAAAKRVDRLGYERLWIGEVKPLVDRG